MDYCIWKPWDTCYKYPVYNRLLDLAKKFLCAPLVLTRRECMIYPRVDLTAWEMELERVAPKLKAAVRVNPIKRMQRLGQ